MKLISDYVYIEHYPITWYVVWGISDFHKGSLLSPVREFIKRFKSKEEAEIWCDLCSFKVVDSVTFHKQLNQLPHKPA